MLWLYLTFQSAFIYIYIGDIPDRHSHESREDNSHESREHNMNPPRKKNYTENM